MLDNVMNILISELFLSKIPSHGDSHKRAFVKAFYLFLFTKGEKARCSFELTSAKDDVAFLSVERIIAKDHDAGEAKGEAHRIEDLAIRRDTH